MDTSLHLFSRRGFDGTSVSEITRRVGVAQGTFYWYFKTKDHVVVALLERALDDAGERARPLRDLPVSAREKVLRGIDLLAYLFSEHREVWSLVRSRLADSKLVARVHAVGQRAITIPFEEVIAEGLADGSIRLGKPPDLVARLLVQAVDAAFTDEHTRDDPRVLETTKWLVDRALSDGS